MSAPIASGYRLKVDHKIKDSQYRMKSADIYRDYYGIGFMFSGTRLIITPGRTLVAKQGVMTFIGKDLHHRTAAAMGALENRTPYETIGVKFDLKIADKLMKVVGCENFNQLFDDVIIYFDDDSQKKIITILKDIETEWNNYSEFSEDVIISLLTILFVTVIRCRIIAPNITHSVHSDADSPLIVALKFLDSNFYKNPSLSETAHACGVSEAHLSRLFSERLGSSYSTFLNEEKINHAQRLLVNTNLSMSDIAYQSGFTTSSYFCDVFKKAIGVSPLQFRKWHQSSSQ